MKDKATKTVVRQVKTTVIDENGVIKKETEKTESRVEREPDYVKVYLEDLLRITDIPKAGNAILMAIIKRMTWNTNDIVLIAPIKKQIAEELNISLVTVSKAVESFTSKSILLRKDRGLYLVNPYFFGKGNWDDLQEIRLTVAYSKSGRMILKTDFDYEGRFSKPSHDE